MINDLTQRQLEVLIFLANGLTVRQVADEMGIQTQTVKNHLHKIYHQLGVTNRYGAFLEMGWLTPPTLPQGH